MTRRETDAAHRQTPPLILVGTDFHRAGLELRGRLAYGHDEVPEALVHLLAREEVAEACLLSTCNRTEVYALPRGEEGAYQAVVEAIFHPRVPDIDRRGRLYVHWHEAAALHLFAVSSGLESMVLGEPEILGQVKQAAAIADDVGASGTVLRRLLASAVTAGRRARQETDVATGAVSFGYCVVELARNIFSHLEDCRILLIGAGEMAEQVARNLRERGARALSVANRGSERAEAFRLRFDDVTVLPLDAVPAAIAETDLVVSSIGGEEPVLEVADVRRAMARRTGRPLLAVDLGVPRNIDPKVRSLENVFLHDIDSMEALIARNLERRREEVPRVEKIIEQELGRFHGWHQSLGAEPLVADLQRRAEIIRKGEVEAALERFPPETHRHLEQLTRSLVRKLLHHPSTRLRREQQPVAHLELVRELFQLDPRDDEDQR